MSKKKFSSGLDSLFTRPVEAPEATAPHIETEADAEVLKTAVSTVIKRAASKTFTSDLDSLFQEAFTDAVEEKMDKLRRENGLDEAFEKPQRKFKQPLSGLDALIRSTVDTSLAGLDHAAVKRLTIMFENQKIEKLKSIARQERSFVKDLVTEVLSEFIENYEKQKGLPA